MSPSPRHDMSYLIAAKIKRLGREITMEDVQAALDEAPVTWKAT